ncbi:hypothetical protein PISL3812_07833 [Talaromyces islandicus]|uniref:Nucleoside phosphorylase domain-containing protein n=1 Tax=Talaromyces islandicus TaxID=28573 RepID=A0A0U1M597_TALIS|nr:hypothetical protein PISL3812_07833 [Talaromyces islandicus]
MDIRLGDVVVSMPIAGSAEGGVVQYDYGKALSGGHFQRTGMLSRPPQILLTSVAKLWGNHLLEGSRVPQFLDEIISKSPRNSFNFGRPKEEDRLFEAIYDHVPSSETCQDCDTRRTVSRPERDDDTPVIHYGLIASGNQVIKDSMVRDRLSQELGVLCVEMEAAGLMDNFPCLVVRGICDYADSHKNKAWQGYAAAAAAAYAKELLLVISVIHKEPVRESLSDSDKFRVPLDLSAVSAISGFLGRESDLDDLWEVLRPRQDSMRRVAVLHSLGGIGKTQLAIRFARIH